MSKKLYLQSTPAVPDKTRMPSPVNPTVNTLKLWMSTRDEFDDKLKARKVTVKSATRRILDVTGQTLAEHVRDVLGVESDPRYMRGAGHYSVTPDSRSSSSVAVDRSGDADARPHERRPADDEPRPPPADAEPPSGVDGGGRGDDGGGAIEPDGGGAENGAVHEAGAVSAAEQPAADRPDQRTAVRTIAAGPTHVLDAAGEAYATDEASGPVAAEAGTGDSGEQSSDARQEPGADGDVAAATSVGQADGDGEPFDPAVDRSHWPRYDSAEDDSDADDAGEPQLGNDSGVAVMLAKDGGHFDGEPVPRQLHRPRQQRWTSGLANRRGQGAAAAAGAAGGPKRTSTAPAAAAGKRRWQGASRRRPLAPLPPMGTMRRKKLWCPMCCGMCSSSHAVEAAMHMLNLRGGGGGGTGRGRGARKKKLSLYALQSATAFA